MNTSKQISSLNNDSEGSPDITPSPDNNAMLQQDISIPNNNSEYYYSLLCKTAKNEQTDELVRNAVENFLAPNHVRRILKYVAKKRLTPYVCSQALKHNGLNLAYVPDKIINKELCLDAVRSDADALRYVPEEFKDLELYEAAIQSEYSDNALEWIPRNILNSPDGKNLCTNAIAHNGLALKYTPSKYITKKLSYQAVSNTKPTTIGFNPYRDWPIQYVPTRFMSPELINLSLDITPDSIAGVPAKFITPELCFELIQANPEIIRSIPEEALKASIVDHALEENPSLITHIPEKYQTKSRCFNALKKDPTIDTSLIPEEIRIAWEKSMPLKSNVEPVSLPLQESKQDPLSIANNHTELIHELAVDGKKVEVIHYISDIHLEHQLDLTNASLFDAKQLISDKSDELYESVNDRSALLLIAGDTAHSVELEELFFNDFSSYYKWQGDIICVLGNHELWNGDPKGINEPEPIDDIINKYREAMPYRVRILENELYLNFKGIREGTLSEEEILSIDNEELREVCKRSTRIILGGIGFSGLNPKYNANAGLYRNTVTYEEDLERTKRFSAIYEKLLVCAYDLPVIVLTHTPVSDWTEKPCNPAWIYINGHTHQQKLIHQDDGVTVLADNQIGYKKKKLGLKSFTTDKTWYDPFKNLPDGIHLVDRKDYLEFVRCREIVVEGFKSPGNVYALKRNNTYMFILKAPTGIFLLEGGKKNKLSEDIDYYYSNLSKYVDIIKSAFAPYNNFLQKVSEEVKLIGGSGLIHGCIVDIDWFNHIYINPFDGTITPYYATDIIEKYIYNDIRALLAGQAEDEMLLKLTELSEQKKLPILSNDNQETTALACIPIEVLDTTMYQPSRIMRSIQYVLENDVVRIWNDELLSHQSDNGSTRKLLS